MDSYCCCVESTFLYQLQFVPPGSHNVEGDKPPSSVRLPAPKSPARESNKKIGEAGDQRFNDRSNTGSPSPPDGSYGGYHLSYEVKKLM